jgi:riboflavin kinase/FMN adenylyltransferase
MLSAGAKAPAGAIPDKDRGKQMVTTTSSTELPEVPRAVAIGTFDGVHVGHRHLVGRILASGLVPTVVTFDPHPRLVLGRAVQMISPLSRRLELFEELGVRDVLVVPFTPAVARQTPQEWIDSVLRPIGTAKVVVGANFRFGHRACGTAATLREHGLEVDQIPLQDAASSTRIRALVDQGDVVSANALLGRPVEIEGLTSKVSSPHFSSQPFSTTHLSLVRDRSTLVPPSGRYRAETGGQRAEVDLDRATGRLTVWCKERLAFPGAARIQFQLRGRQTCLA